MADFPYTLKQIAQITGKSNTSLFAFINENREFINQHIQKNGRHIKYDEDALQEFIKRFGRVDKSGVVGTTLDSPPEGTETTNKAQGEQPPQASVIEAFETEIDALKNKCAELAHKLEAREKDCEEWRLQAGQALNALSKEQDRVARLEERLAGYLPAPSTKEEQPAQETRKLSFSQRIRVLFGRGLDFK